MPDAPLSILIVEDEMLVAMDIEATFLDEHWTVLGPVPDIPRALSAIERQRPDAVCLDMNLNGTPSVAIAETLKKRGIPFVVLTGYSLRNVNDAAYQGAPVVHKPFECRDLIDAVRTAMQADSRAVSG